MASFEIYVDIRASAKEKAIVEIEEAHGKVPDGLQVVVSRYISGSRGAVFSVTLKGPKAEEIAEAVNATQEP